MGIERHYNGPFKCEPIDNRDIVQVMEAERRRLNQKRALAFAAECRRRSEEDDRIEALNAPQRAWAIRQYKTKAPLWHIPVIGTLAAVIGTAVCYVLYMAAYVVM